MKYLNYRPLTLTEHGQHVRDLRDAAMRLHDRALSTPLAGEQERYDLADALARFDAAVKDE